MVFIRINATKRDPICYQKFSILIFQHFNKLIQHFEYIISTSIIYRFNIFWKSVEIFQKCWSSYNNNNVESARPLLQARKKLKGSINKKSKLHAWADDEHDWQSPFVAATKLGV